MKCVDIGRNTSGEGDFLGEHLMLSVRKRGQQTGLDTLVVHAVNDETRCWGKLSLGVAANALSSPPGEYAGNGKAQRN